MAEEAAAGLSGPDRDAWTTRLTEARPEMADSVEWFIGEDDVQGALRLCGALWGFWNDESMFDQGRELLERALAADTSGKATEARVGALIGAGTPAFRQGDQAGARANLARGREIARALGDQRAEAGALVGLMRVALRDGDHGTVRRLGEEVTGIGERLGDTAIVARPVHFLAAMARIEGKPAEAKRWYERSIEHSREVGNERMLTVEMENLAFVEKNLGNVDRARQIWLDLLEEFRSASHWAEAAFGLIGLGVVAVAGGEHELGATLLGAGGGEFERLGRLLDPDDAPEFDQAVAAARASLGPGAFETAWERGRGMTVPEAVELALTG